MGKEIITYLAGEKKTSEYKNINNNNNRKSISKPLRDKIWNYRIGNDINKSKCICCNDKNILIQGILNVVISNQ